MKKSIISLSVLSILVLASCSNEHNQDAHENHDTSASVVKEEVTNSATVEHSLKEVSPATREMMKSLFGHYTHLKNALVNADVKEAQMGAQAMLDVLNKFDVSKITAEEKKILDSHLAPIKEDASHIVENNEIAHQREHLVSLSTHVYELVKAFGVEKEVYYSYCPMANNDKGAYWVSEIKEIKNPYFGNDMLTCGEVKETIK